MLDIAKNQKYLNDEQYWIYGPCFEVRFYFQKKRCSPPEFEKVLLADPIVLTPSQLKSPISKDIRETCFLSTGNGREPLGFRYFGENRGDYDYYCISIHPFQIKRHCGEFYSHGADNPQGVMRFHAELLTFVRRLHSQLNFHLAFMSDESAPWITTPHASLTGILIYDWLARQGDFGSSEFVESNYVKCCYALLPFN
jgi:hypothetical protein